MIKHKRNRDWIALFVASIVFFARHLSGADYYVDQNHISSSDANSGAATSPWRTIAKANQTVAPGDTVYIKAGTYNDPIAPGRSGTASALITYRNWGSDRVTIANATRGISLVGKSYVSVQGIQFYNLDSFMWIENGSHNDIGYCTFDQMRNAGQWSGSRIWYDSRYNRVHHCVFSKFGYFTASDDIAAILDIGNENNGTDHSDYNLIEDNTMLHAGHHVLGINSMRNVIRNNYFHNENWYNGYGDRVLYLNGDGASSGWNLIEGNKIAFAGTPPDNPVANGIQLSTKNNIVRLNCLYGNTSAGLGMSVTAAYWVSPEHNRIYNNTFFTNGWHSANGAEGRCGVGLAHYGGSFTLVGNAIINNIFHRNPTSIGTYRVNLADQVIAGNWEQTADPRFVDILSPLNYTNASLPDFRLRADSPCIDRGVFLTTIASASGSGRTFQLADASYFIDGWGIVQGDLIQLQGSTRKVRITGINYATRTVTVDSDLAWSQRQGVALAYEGAAPDIGAFEFGSSPGTDTNMPPSITLAFSPTVAFPTNTVALGGTVTDPNGDSLTFAWQQISGPASALFSPSASLNTTATVSARGTYVFRLIASDGKASAIAEATVTFSPDPNTLTFEAEAGAVSAPFVLQSGYIMQNSLTSVTGGGRASYVFSVPQPGDYIVTAVVNAPDEGANSIFVNIDAEPADPVMIWDVPVTSGFEPRTVSWRGSNGLQSPKVFSLTAGSHTLIVRGREPGTQLDRFEVTRAINRPAAPANLRVVLAP